MILSRLFPLFLAVIFYACVSPVSNYRAMLDENPEGLLALEDSLMSLTGFSGDTAMVNMLVEAHVSVSESLEFNGDLSGALAETEKAVALNPAHKKALYRMYMIQGHINYNHGNIWKLWDAIELYTKAAEIFPYRGEPLYWKGRTFEKKDDRDYESILEAYEKAASILPECPMLDDTRERIKRIQAEKTTFENFWR